MIVPRHWYIKQRQRERLDGVSLTKLVLFYVCGAIWACVIFSILVGFIFIWAASRPVRGHATHHASYQSWFNSALPKPQGCCNNTDCRELADADERELNGVLAVRVEGAWCPVEPRHYLSRGNVPNASVSHACVSAHYGGKTPCEKFICYQPKPRM